jgi:hypothetical protein
MTRVEVLLDRAPHCAKGQATVIVRNSDMGA